MKFIVHRSSFIVVLFAATALAQPVRITQKPEGLVHGMLYVPATVADNVTRVELYVNNVKWTEAHGKNVVMPVPVGDYIRRLRIRVVGYDAQNNIAGEDEMVVNDPQPPFRVHLQSGEGMLSTAIVKPPELAITSADFLVGEEKIGTATVPPY